MYKTFLSLTVMLFWSTAIFAQHTTYYVDQANGSNSNSGTSPSTALSNFDSALNMVTAGDTISIVGTYHNPSYDPNYTYSAPDDAHLWHNEQTLRINNVSGNANGYITIKAYDQNTKLLGDGANIIRITNSAYIRIEDFNIEGEVERIPLSTALALQFVYIIDDGNLTGTVTDPAPGDIHYRNLDEVNDNDGIVEETDVYTDLSNFSVKRPTYIDTRGIYASNCNHLIIEGNTIHHMPGGGLRISDGKNSEINENELYRNSARSYSGTHALVVTKTKPIGSNDYSIEITRNSVHHNYNEMFSWAPTKTKITPRIDEGKGISLQRNNKNNWIHGQGRILVANNICYWNGFSGVHSNDGYRIDMINNTCFMNSYTNSITYANQTQLGKNIGISCQRSHFIHIINNISVIDGSWGGYALAASNSDNLTVSDNVIFSLNGSLSQDSDIQATHTIVQDPLFEDAPAAYQDWNYNFDFHLQSGSPAIDQGNSGNFVPTIDFNGNQRDSHPDIGAYEFFATGINSFDNLANLNIYPNPVIDFLSISNLNKQVDYQVFNLEGKLLRKGVVQNNQINLSDLSSGIYFVRINQQTFKVIKE